MKPEPPALKSYVLTRIILVTGVFALVLITGCEWYLRAMFEREQTARFRTAIEASASAIRSDLEIGDLWSVRRNLTQVLDSGTIRAITIQNEQTGEALLSLPDGFDPDSAGTPYILHEDSGAAGLHWRLVGYPGPRTVSIFETRARSTYFAIVVALLMAFAFCAWVLATRLAADIETIDRSLARINVETEVDGADPGLSTREARRAFLQIQESSRLLVGAVREQKRMAVESAVSQALFELSAQVAHDIRSPLAALEVAAGDVSQLPEDKRVLIRSAVNRIRDIANSLLSRQGTFSPGGKITDVTDASSDDAEAGPQLLSSLIESLVTEKRLQFRSNSRVEIEAWLDAASYGIFARVQSVEFKRLLSNLINNAVEASEDAPNSVRVNLSTRSDRARVSVHDNGKGIPPEILGKLGRLGETYGKTGGSGMGLHHARTSAESWGGHLELDSEVGKGTTATIDLPQAPTPDWFVSELSLLPNSAVVILDDDASIHQIWQGRFESARAKERGIEILHISTPDGLRAWVGTNGSKIQGALYLMDYELLGHLATGLSLAEELGIGDRTILVTSRFEEKGILTDSRRLKVRLIPKPLAGFVPIHVAEENAPRRLDAVLIDDDPLARMTWKMAASRAAKNFQPYSTMAEFLQAAGGIPRETPIYVDAELADGVDGAEASRGIHKLGFQEIYLATGHDAEKFSSFKHLRGVVGKEPPWNEASTTPRSPSQESV
jgi:signal transduction histidine kinase